MIKSTGIVRKVDELGRVVLPMDLRRRFGIEERDSLEILLDEEAGQIVFQKAAGTCLRCQSAEGLVELRPGYCLCRTCLDQLR